MSECVFCAIAAGRQPASIVYRDRQCMAFMDICPINPGHTLVVPLTHSADLAHLSPDDGAAVFMVAQRIAVALAGGALSECGVRCEGVNLLLSDGAPAGQVVGHVHLHVVPRYGGDGAGFRRGAVSGSPPDRRELSLQATALAQGIGTATPASAQGR